MRSDSDRAHFLNCVPASSGLPCLVSPPLRRPSLWSRDSIAVLQGGRSPLLKRRESRNALMPQQLVVSCTHHLGDHAMADKDLKALFVHQLKDTYFAENAILKALPQMAEAAQSEELKGALAVHLKETEGQVKRLEQEFQLVGERPEGVECKAIQGIIEEGQ